MENWWLSLETYQKTIWAIAIVSSLIFIIQSAITLLGMDAEVGMDMETDMDGDGPFQLFTFRNIVHFLIGFCWTFIATDSHMKSKFFVFLIAFAVGAGLVFSMLFMFRKLAGFVESGTLDIDNSIGQTGSVYLRIPGHKSGIGKVQIKVQGSLRELDAMTEQEEIPTGNLIKVTQVLSGNILIVENL